MQIHRPESWPVTAAEAIALQQTLAPEVLTADCLPDPIRRVAGVDAGFEANGQIARAAVVVLSFPELTPVDGHSCGARRRFPTYRVCCHFGKCRRRWMPSPDFKPCRMSSFATDKDSPIPGDLALPATWEPFAIAPQLALPNPD
nr:hypothetical protein [Rubidibacter lacunae]